MRMKVEASIRTTTACYFRNGFHFELFFLQPVSFLKTFRNFFLFFRGQVCLTSITCATLVPIFVPLDKKPLLFHLIFKFLLKNDINNVMNWQKENSPSLYDVVICLLRSERRSIPLSSAFRKRQFIT